MRQENNKKKRMFQIQFNYIFGFKKQKIKLLKKNIRQFLKYEIIENKNNGFLRYRNKNNIKKLLKNKIRFNYFFKKQGINFNFKYNPSAYSSTSYQKKIKKVLNSFAFNPTIYGFMKIKNISNFAKFYIGYKNYSPYNLSTSLYGDFQHYPASNFKEMFSQPDLIKKTYQKAFEEDQTSNFSFLTGTPYTNPLVTKYNNIWSESLTVQNFDNTRIGIESIIGIESDFVFGSDSLLAFNWCFLEQKIPELSENIFFNKTVSSLITNRTFLCKINNLILSGNFENSSWTTQELFLKNEQLYEIVLNIYQNNFLLLNHKFNLSLIAYNNILEYTYAFNFI